VSGALELVADSPVGSLVLRLEFQGLTLAAVGDRIRVRPSSRLTPDLRVQIENHRSDLLAWLNGRDAETTDGRRTVGEAGAVAPVQFVTLKGGLTVPRSALELAIDLERRGISLKISPEHQFIVPNDPRLTTPDLAAIRRWHAHLAAIVAYEAPEA
jgi:hypothetical protein